MKIDSFLLGAGFYLFLKRIKGFFLWKITLYLKEMEMTE
jgi:hypothetical protein